MFVLSQRVSILSTSLLASRRLSIIKNDKIKINKFNIYYKDCIDLED